MKITIKVTKELEKFTKSNPVEIEFNDKNSVSLFDSLDELVNMYPNTANILFESNGGLNYHILIFINDKPVQNKDEKTIMLKSGDEINILPVIGGG